jgi:DNA-binding transcriptional MerR regulator
MAAKPKPKTEVDDALVTQCRVAELCGCAPRTLREYLSRGIIPTSARGTKGTLYERAAVSAVVNHFRESAAGRSVSTGLDGDTLDPVAEGALLKRQQRMESEERTKLHQHKLRLARGEVITAGAVNAALAGQISVARQRLLSLPQALANRCPGLAAPVVVAADDLVRSILGDLAQGARRDIENEIRKQAGLEVEHDEEVADAGGLIPTN